MQRSGPLVVVGLALLLLPSLAIPLAAHPGQDGKSAQPSVPASAQPNPPATNQSPSTSVGAGAVKPAITALSAASGTAGSKLTIKGTGFDVKSAGDTVKFGQTPATVAGATATTLSTVVPAKLAAGQTTVTVTTLAGTSNTWPFQVVAKPVVKPAKPAASVVATVAPVTWYGVVSGDFSPFINAAGNLVAIHINILNQDLQIIGEATTSSLSPTDKSKLQMFYTQSDPKAVPAYVLVGTTRPGDHQYPFAPIAKPASSDPSVVSYRQVITGDFCLPDQPVGPALWGQCTTGLLTLNPSTGESVSPANPLPDKVEAYVQAADGTSQKATVNSIGPDSVDIAFTATAGLKPAWLVLVGTNGARRFAYAPAPPVQDSDLIYTSDDLETICDIDASGTPDCIHTAAADLALKPVASAATANLVALHDKLLVAQIRAPLGSEPTAILVTNSKNNPSTSVIVRRTIKPGANNNLLNVDMTIMDQLTAQRNYGNRIAKRYIAVTLDVKNPTSKKVQFNKSATYFDVDYVEAKQSPGFFTDFAETIASASVLGLWQPSVYNPPFVPLSRDGKPPRVARFGLEQNVKHSPVNYLEVLGSFDYTTQKTDDALKAVELVGSVLSNIATGGLVADTSGAFRAGTSVFSGTFLPGVRGIVLDTSFINRLRTNLVAQTLQETIQVPANSSATTVVLLPRTGILSFTDATVPVMVNRVIDVHLIPEVVTEVTAPTVEKGSCKVGYTMDQTRQALGEPPSVAPSGNGSIFTYPKGPVASASFDAGGSLVSCQLRSISDQLAQPTTLADMNTVLTSLSLTANKITLTDGSTVLTDIPGVQQTYHFDAKGNKTTDYTFLFPKIKAFETQPKSALDSFLEAQAKTLLPARSELITTEATQADTAKTATATYDSPDVQNGKIVITFDNKPPAAPKGSNVKTITFTGDKPQSVN